MKLCPTLLVTLTILPGLSVALGQAQPAVLSTNPPPVLPPLPLVTNAVEVSEALDDATRLPAARFPSLEPPPPLPAPVRHGGLIGQAREAKAPLQLFNPLAPASYGDGTRNLSLNPQTGRGEGLVLFSFQFKSKGATKKPKPPRGDR